MKIISCGACGVLLDTDILMWTDIESDEYPTETYTICPVCKNRIDKE